MSQRKWSERRVPWGTIIAIVLLGGVVGFELNRKSAQAAPAEAPAQKPPSPTRVFAEGRLTTRAGAEITVAAEMAGRVARLGTTEERTVQAGDVLVELGAEEERAALTEARSRLGEARVDLDYAKKELTRTQQLAQGGVSTPADLDAATHAADAANARIRALYATIARIETALEKARIVAPISGLVTTQHADVGEVVAAGAPLFTIVDLSQLRVEVEVGEFDIARVKQGSKATIVAEGFDGKSWEGRVVEIPAWVTSRRLKPLDPGRPTDTRVLPVKVSLPPDHPLKLGQRVEVEIDSTK